MNTGPCAECGENAHHKDGCRAWETQLHPKTADGTAPLSPLPTEETWRVRFTACREIRRLLQRAEDIASDRLLENVSADGIVDDRRLDQSYERLRQLVAEEITTRLGGDGVRLDALAMLLPLEFQNITCGDGGPYAGCFGCTAYRLPHKENCTWLALMRRAGLR